MASLSDLRLRFWISLAMRAILHIDGGPSLLHRLRPGGAPPPRQPHPGILPIRIPTAHGQLDALVAMPTAPSAAIVICHGIGDRLIYWQDVQSLLLNHNLATLLFDYAGYGASTGSIGLETFRTDTRDAYLYMLGKVPAHTPVFLLGLSMGTGVAADAAPHIHPPPAGLILCQSFHTLRAAAAEVTRSTLLARLIPNVWRTADILPQLTLPTLIVHSDADQLFPLHHAHTLLASANPANTSLAVPSGFAHNAVYLRPSLAYWQPIFDFIARHTAVPAID